MFRYRISLRTTLKRNGVIGTPRQLRMEYHNAFYHVMNRGKGRQQIFHDERYYQVFLDTIAEVQARFAAVIHCYCLMSNHYPIINRDPLS